MAIPVLCYDHILIDRPTILLLHAAQHPSIARYIGAQVWNNGGDIRDCISIGKLVRKDDGPEDIAGIISTISKYNKKEVEKK
jgi:hypothetical protein